MKSTVLGRLRKTLFASLVVTSLVAGLSVAGSNVPAANAATAKAPVGWLHTSGSKVMNSKNKEHVIKAVAWFGMETANCAPHGLWTISLDQGLKTIASQGFNTIRLPYANQCIGGAPVTGVDFYKNPSLKGKSSLQVMDQVIKRAQAFGLSVILDRHRPDYGSQSEFWYTSQYSEARWISDWKMLAKRYKSNSTVIGFDLHNEPRGNVCWGCGDPKRDWKIASAKAGNAIHSVNPKLLIVVEGIERSKDGANYWWGGNMRDFGSKPLKLKVANRVVYSPHTYPSTVYNQQWFSDPRYPANLPGVWDKNWGYLKKKGYPVLLGEFGTKYETKSDKLWLKSLVSYLKKNNMSFAYWSFNPNSGDTGGIMKDDWTSLQREKLAALKPLLGNSSTVTPKPTPKPTTPVKPTPKPTKPPVKPTPKPSVPAPKPTAPASAEYLLQNKWEAGYVVDLLVKGPSGSPRSWSVSWSDPNAVSVSNAWGAKCDVASGVITCVADGYGKDNFQWGTEVRVGLQVSSTNGQSAPTAPKLTLK